MGILDTPPPSLATCTSVFQKGITVLMTAFGALIDLSVHQINQSGTLS
jgi:hypothetical protein